MSHSVCIIVRLCVTYFKLIGRRSFIVTIQYASKIHCKELKLMIAKLVCTTAVVRTISNQASKDGLRQPVLGLPPSVAKVNFLSQIKFQNKKISFASQKVIFYFSFAWHCNISTRLLALLHRLGQSIFLARWYKGMHILIESNRNNF